MVCISPEDSILAPARAAAGRAVVCLALCIAALGAIEARSAGIYTCVDSQGKHRTSDRPIPECLDLEQRVLNKDGSQRKVLGPRQTPQERAAAEEARRARDAAEVAHNDAVRRDRNLIARYPNEGAHNKARGAALDDVRKSVDVSEKRINDLRAERKTLQAEAEFYKGKALPYKLRTALEANQATHEAQEQIIGNNRAEMVRINALYDAELSRVRRLWAGAAPGSLPEAPVQAPLQTLAPPPVARPAP